MRTLCGEILLMAMGLSRIGRDADDAAGDLARKKRKAFDSRIHHRAVRPRGDVGIAKGREV
jgi:hypothetical protein